MLVSVPRFFLFCVKEFRAEQKRFGARLRAELANIVGVEPTAVGDDSDGGAVGDGTAASNAETSARMRIDVDGFYSALLATMPHWPESVVGVVYEQVCTMIVDENVLLPVYSPDLPIWFALFSGNECRTCTRRLGFSVHTAQDVHAVLCQYFLVAVVAQRPRSHAIAPRRCPAKGRGNSGRPSKCLAVSK